MSLDASSGALDYNLTFTFLGLPVPAGQLVLASFGLGAQGSDKTKAQVAKNGTFLGDWALGSPTTTPPYGPTAFTGSAGSFNLTNSLADPAPGYFNTNWGVTRINDAVQSLTISLHHVFYDGIGFTVGLANNGSPVAPTASAVTITGTPQVGQILTGSYTYADINSDPQGISTFRWLRNGVAIVGATASTYTLVAADLNTSITFEVTPVATIAPTTGTPVVSSAFAPVIANDGDVPTLPEWGAIIFGMLLLGTTLWKQRRNQG